MKVTGLSEIVRQQRISNEYTLIKMYAFIVNKMQKRSFNDDGDLEYTDRYLFVKLIACRSKQPAITSFRHRFKDDNDMALIEDINLPRPVSTQTEVDFIRNRVDANGTKTKGKRII